MNEDRLAELLRAVRERSTTVEDALERLRDLPYADLGDLKLDLHRELRRGAPEVIFGLGKSPEQVAAAASGFLTRGAPAFVTRLSLGVHAAARALLAPVPAVDDYDPRSQTWVLAASRRTCAGPELAVVTAGASDVPVAEEAARTAEFLGHPVTRIYDVGVAGLHRVLDARERLRRAGVVVVIAGMEGALASVVGGLTGRPVIAVPTSVGYGASFGGMAALLGMLSSCAGGVVVVNIDNGFGAAYAAHAMLQPLP